ncbi:hypothetical protein O163_08115 [Caldanaerobacter subterraneus subsp. yonseiensis KB-1]|uniref:Uncharacterized protein n=1 Tax=Caldanaerobacter subterraneus subsp. yonseiensis KB-1 TaxID=1388761 RepID=U5CG76_CALSX|nr:hypothetical protein [Caldanaerobacter subterraneus]ERM91910.1 hypothetical protein O163_08115 [Caldanaerobacter subterraneus subsp. yonseiensis KB-1]
MSPLDFIKEFYLSLLEQGWTMNDIDEMDFFWYLDLLIYKASQKEKKKYTTIDKVIGL